MTKLEFDLSGLDVSKLDLTKVSVNVAEYLMGQYERASPASQSRSRYLDIAEINLESAQRQGIDVAAQYARLSQLRRK